MSGQPVLAVETLKTFLPEAVPLMSAHAVEVGALEDRSQFVFDQPQAQAAEKIGMLLICTARDDKVLVGYCVWFLTSNLIRYGQLIAMQSGWYLTPRARVGSLGLRLFRFAFRQLRARGVVEAFPHFWAKSPSGVAKVFERLGATPAESVYRVVLQ